MTEHAHAKHLTCGGTNGYRYTFRMICDEVPGLSMDDGAVRIFLHTHGKNDDEMSLGPVEFLYYVENPEQQEREI